MNESIEDLVWTKDENQKRANELKEKRNQLHLKSKKFADERDSLNSAIRDVRNKISEHKKKRDELNERVRHAKEQRNKLNKSYGDIKKQIEMLQKERMSSSGANLNELRKQLRTLENEQMTQPMSPQKEKKFIEMISFNEEGIVDNIQKILIELRKQLIMINENIDSFTEKELKLLNLDYERLIIMSSDE